MKAYQSTINELLQKYKTSAEQGLSSNEVRQRLEKHGPNTLPEPPRDPLLLIFVRQFQNPLIYILLIAAAIIFFVGNKMDAFIISGVLSFNAILGTIQEGRTQNILDRLRHFITTTSVVLRDGEKEVIHDENIVVGDIIVLHEGERIPADARLIEVNNLKIDEALLTGESEGIIKTSGTISREASIADQINMVFRGTSVLSGSGKAIVTAIGSDTEIGHLHISIEGIRTDMPLKHELDRLARGVLVLIFILCVALLGIGLLLGKTFTDLLVMLTALFICVVPEGLPVVLTLVLVTGAHRMAKKNILVKRLRAVDALGRTEVIVLDKTGTLTRNEMVVSQVYVSGQLCSISGSGYFKQGTIRCNGTETMIGMNPHIDALALAGTLLNRSEIEYVKERDIFKIKGEPLEAAMYIFAQKLGLDEKKVYDAYSLIYEIPFDREYAYHAGFYKYNGKCIAFVVGAPEIMKERCHNFDTRAQESLDKMLAVGLRIVSVGAITLNLDQVENHGNDLTFFKSKLESIEFMGFFGIQDAIRPDVIDMISQSRDAGLHIVMATGDHKKTALYVAKRVGIYREGDEVVEGKDLEALAYDELMSRLARITVFARVTPADKLRIVRLFHDLGEVVAMTGDGVNDTPPLIAADVGIAMGGIGTEVAKAAADVVLLDDSFVHVVSAVEQGRHILYALRRVVLYFFTTNLGEVLVVMFALLLNFPLPILAAQILWLNFVTDGFLDVALAMEPKEDGLLRQDWFKKSRYLIDKSLIIKTLYMAIPMGLGSLIIFSFYYHTDLDKARTLTMVTMALYQWFNAWNCRSERKPIFEIGWFSNRWLIAATVLVGVLQVLVVRMPMLQRIFKTVPLSAKEFGLILLFTAPLFFFEEARKWVVRTREQRVDSR
ncbi:HAD-IC family P-type ATPase [Candidatus Babeliales bacterium]|nr:HAD-IC family P-type ATPase [Candidatus Babeliales bacterium]